jgi:signal transduction histidine kinase
MSTVCDPITAAELARMELFADDSAEALEWMAARFVVRCYSAGEEMVRSGDAAREFMVVLSGEFHFRRDSDVYGGAFVRLPGEVAGVLPFSRMSVYQGRGWAVQDSRALFMDASELRELVQRAPCLTQKLVNGMIDRARDATQRDERANKMLALGKLSAGLAHELNNPAAAVVRSSARLREVLVARRRSAIAMTGEAIPAEARARMNGLSDRMVEAAEHPQPLDELEQSDREMALTDWLEEHGLPGDVAAALVRGGIQAGDLAPLAAALGAPALSRGLEILAADYEIFSLSREIEEASRRIADLVQSVKSYTYMDRVPVTEVDVEQGIETTVRMFQHRLKNGYHYKREFAGNLPKLRGNGSELNQIWTNLIDNALDAMSEAETKVLEIRTALEPGMVLVEVTDSGSGIPVALQARIFDAFFTTKEVGKGTGLGLDIVHRIVRDHRGTIQVQSRPGRTSFQVRLPV